MIAFMLNGVAIHHLFRGIVNLPRTIGLVALMFLLFCALSTARIYGPGFAGYAPPSFGAAVALFGISSALPARLFAWRGMSWAASISYPLYVVHGVGGSILMRMLAGAGIHPHVCMILTIAAAIMLVGVLDRLIRHRTQLASSIRGYAGEFGMTAAKGMAHLVPPLDRIPADEELPALARDLFASHARECSYRSGSARRTPNSRPAIGPTNAVKWAGQGIYVARLLGKRLVKIPGVGPVGAMLLRMKTPEPGLFRSGRQFAAWIGLTPKDHSTAGNVELGVITRAGDQGLRSVLVVGATAVIQQARRSGKTSPWLAELLRRKSPKLAAVALAHQTARIAWKLMAGEAYTVRTPAVTGVV